MQLQRETDTARAMLELAEASLPPRIDTRAEKADGGDPPADSRASERNEKKPGTAPARPATRSGARLGFQHPVRVEAVRFRTLLSDFIEENIKQEPQLGFSRGGSSGIPVRDFLEALKTTSKTLGRIINDDRDRGSIGINSRALAQQLQSLVDEYRLVVVDATQNDYLTSPRAKTVTAQSIGTRNQVGAVLQQLDRFLLEVRSRMQADMS